jgi:arabinose-5-phosphate isomerase
MNPLHDRIAAVTAKITAEAARLLHAEAAALQRAAENLTPDFAAAVAMLLAAETIIVTGVGKSGIVARKIAATLNSVSNEAGSRAMFLHPVEALHGDVGFVRRGDVVLMLSKSGSTAELLSLIPTLTERGVAMIGILGAAGDSPLARLCKVVLDASVTHEACPLGIAPMSSTTVAMALGDALAGALMQAQGFTAADFAANHAAGQLGRNLTMQVRDVMHTGAALPRVPQGASFRQILAELTAKGLGCVCVCGESESLAGIITDGDVRRALETHTSLESLHTDDMMTASPLSIQPNALLGTALELMEDRPRQISVLPVADVEKRLLGVIRVHDILRAGM